MAEKPTENTTGKTVSGPKASIATFVRPRDGVRIYVFARPGESSENAIARVKRKNGCADVVHDVVKH